MGFFCPAGSLWFQFFLPAGSALWCRFSTMNSIDFNGKIVDATEPVLVADNKGYRYGDGLFETMKIFRGRIMLEDLHFERLYYSLGLLGMRLPKLLTREKLVSAITVLCRKNKADQLGRVRLRYRGAGDKPRGQVVH